MSLWFVWVLPLYFGSTSQDMDVNCLRTNPGVLIGEFLYLDEHISETNASLADFQKSLSLFSTRFKQVHKLWPTSLESLRKLGIQESKNSVANNSTKIVPVVLNVYSGTTSSNLNKTILIYQEILDTIIKHNSAHKTPKIEGVYLQPVGRGNRFLVKALELVFGPKELMTFSLGILLEDCQWDLKTPDSIAYFMRLQFITCPIPLQKGLSPQESAHAVLHACDEIRKNARSYNLTAEIICAASYTSQGKGYYGTTPSSINNFRIFWCTIVSELLHNKSHARIIMRAAIDLTPTMIGEDKGALHLDKYHTGWWKRSTLHETVRFVEKVEELPGGMEYEKCKGDCRLVHPLTSFSEPSQSFNLLAITLLTVFAFGGIFMTCIIGFVIYRKRRINKTLSRKELDHFFEGSTNSTKKPTRGCLELHEAVDDLPYDETLEVTKSEIGIYTEKILGSGSFGVVVEGRVGSDEVAVKTTFPGVDKMFLKALMLELKVLTYLGQHENIVNLRGAHTPQLSSGKLYLFLELCKLGNLQKFLRSHRDDFYESMSPEEPIEKDTDKRLTCKDLLQWSVQIASAMVYLTEKRVIHGDIAARNVLIFSWDQVKLTDFGLSRRLYEYTNSVKKKQNPMPWRHMSVEALRDFRFSEKSDVWAFGMTLFEIFSIGEVPFPGISWSLNFIQLLLNGLRPIQPQYAHNLVYEIMTFCWTNEIKLRPPIAVVHSKLISVLHCLFSNPHYVSV